LLPYLEEGNLYAEYDLDETIMEPDNLRVTSSTIGPYLCPSMVLPRGIPDTDCGEHLAPGSYMISSRTKYSDYFNLNGAFDNPPSAGEVYTLSFQHIIDGTSKTLFVGEINYGHRDYLWTDCSSRNGQPKWGDFTWAHGYWFYAWGHMADDFSDEVYNNSTKWLPPYSARVFRSDHPGGVQFVMVDGSVHFIDNSTSREVRRALVTRAGKEICPVLE
jgi:prepilin-type processing-associated H-X9-DG protein